MSHTHSLVRGTLSAGLLIAGLSGSAVAASPIFTSVGNMTVYVKEPIRIQLAATDADGGTLTYSATGMPSGASIGSSTGVFTWQPTLADTGAHPVTFRVSDGANQTAMPVTMTVVMPSLPADGLYKVLRPSAGESYRYGDTLTVVWVMPTCSHLTNLDLHRKPVASQRYQCWFSPPEGVKPAKDTTGTRGGWCYTFADKRMVLCFYKQALAEASLQPDRTDPTYICDYPTLGGDTVTVDSLYIRAFNQYATSNDAYCDQAVQSAVSDGVYNGPFSVVPRSKWQASVMPRSIRPASFSGRDANCVGVFTVSGARFVAPGNSASTRVPAGVYVAKWNVAGHAVTRTIVMTGAGVLPLSGVTR